MSTELLVRTCPVCGGDGTSVASNGELYCVDCNRIYWNLRITNLELESDTGTAEHERPAVETIRKAA